MRPVQKNGFRPRTEKEKQVVVRKFRITTESGTYYSSKKTLPDVKREAEKRYIKNEPVTIYKNETPILFRMRNIWYRLEEV